MERKLDIIRSECTSSQVLLHSSLMLSNANIYQQSSNSANRAVPQNNPQPLQPQQPPPQSNPQSPICKCKAFHEQWTSEKKRLEETFHQEISDLKAKQQHLEQRMAAQGEPHSGLKRNHKQLVLDTISEYLEDGIIMEMKKVNRASIQNRTSIQNTPNPLYRGSLDDDDRKDDHQEGRSGVAGKDGLTDDSNANTCGDRHTGN